MSIDAFLNKKMLKLNEEHKSNIIIADMMEEYNFFSSHIRYR